MRSKLKQWWDKLFHGVKTDKEIEIEKLNESIAIGKTFGWIKETTEYIPTLPQFGGRRAISKYHYRMDYTSDEWDKIGDDNA